VFKKRTIFLALIISILTGMLSLIPNELSRSGYEIHAALIALDWIVLAVSILVFLYCFMSVLGSTILWIITSNPDAGNLAFRANNPFSFFAWKEARERHEKFVQKYLDRLSE
jgi:hypothetical protein